MSIIIGIDHGYYAIKTAHCSFPAGLTSYGEHEPYTRQGLLEFGGCFFVCGSGRQPMVHEHVLLLTEQHSNGLKSFFLVLCQGCSMYDTAQDAVPMPNVPEMDVMWTVTENLLVDVNMSGKDVRSSAQAAQQQAESLIKQMQ